MSDIRTVVIAVATVVFAASSCFAATITVSQSGNAQYQSIQAAVNAAHPGDEVVILDSAIYEEQVTIDSTKNGLILRSESRLAAAKPTIKYQDTIHVGPRNVEESVIDSMINYDRNGALRILSATDVRVEGLVIDGGGVYPYGYDAVWEGRYSLQYGNAAVTCLKSGSLLLRDCDIRGAYYGIYFHDRNEGGVYAPSYATDLATANLMQFSGFGYTGNHLIEYNRIHDNSVGLFLEATWDMGSTIRYNLIYENHHPTAEIATKVKKLSSEGGNQCGGALMFKDHMLSPVAIYNNTFWHNSLIFIGNWKSGGQHLVFNNIFAEPNEYFGDATTSFSQSFEMSKCFTNRMHNCVYAAMQQEPTPSYTTITNDLKVPASSTEGALITPFPAANEIRWVETPFLSTDPSSPHFLYPNWNDSLVKQYLADKGWEVAGVKDPDGSRADLGAIPQGGGRPVDVVTIRPTVPFRTGSSPATLGFRISPRVGTMTGIKLTMIGQVRNLDTMDYFGSAYKAIPASNISLVASSAQTLTMGANSVEVPVSASPGDFAFYEIFAEGTGSDGRLITTAAGFIPYRKLDYTFEITILGAAGGTPVSEVRTGTPVILSIKALRGSTPYSGTVSPISINLSSHASLLDTIGNPLREVSAGITGTTELTVVFPTVTATVTEHVLVAGRSISGSTPLSFFGNSPAITLLPDPTLNRPVENKIVLPGQFRCVVIDLQGRVVSRIDRIENNLSTLVGTPLFRRAGHGVYLVRMIDRTTGRTIQIRRLNVGQ